MEFANPSKGEKKDLQLKTEGNDDSAYLHQNLRSLENSARKLMKKNTKTKVKNSELLSIIVLEKATLFVKICLILKRFFFFIF